MCGQVRRAERCVRMWESSNSQNETENLDGVSPAERTAVGFQRGHPQDVQTVLHRVQRIVSCRGFGIPRDDQKDIVQEAMIQIWRAAARSSFRPEEGFWGFVEVVTARRCIDWYRRARPHLELKDNVVDSKPTPMSSALERERIELARKALAELGEACADLIRFRIELGMSFAEISHEVGRSAGALRVQFHRCIRKAQERISRSHLKGNFADEKEIS